MFEASLHDVEEIFRRPLQSLDYTESDLWARLMEIFLASDIFFRLHHNHVEEGMGLGQC